jgi:y4mF family transcriptional regulator
LELYNFALKRNKMDKKSLLSVFVKNKRKLAKITQIELAEKAGVGLRFVRELEQGKASLRMDKVNDVLLLFGAELGPITLNLLTNE